MRSLVNYLQREEYPFLRLDIRPLESRWGLAISSLLVWARTWWSRREYDLIWLNASHRGLVYLAPGLYLLARLLGKKIVIRPFGTGWYAQYTRANALSRSLFRRSVLAADLLFLQTRALMTALANQGVHMAHLPTSRPEPPTSLQRNRATFSGRLVYLGHIKTSKGISQLLELLPTLPEGYTLHLYGPIKEPQYASLQGQPQVYRGVLTAEEVLPTLAQYDVLLLPTFFAGEGYPGVIIEAFSLGVPVITTRWKDIPEIVADGQTGFLVEPRSSSALRVAIDRLAQANYAGLSRAARLTFQQYHHENKVLAQALRIITNLYLAHSKKPTT